jgi:dipeptidase E
MITSLLMSSSRKGALGYLEHAGDQIRAALEQRVTEVLFVPYAAVTFGYDAYERMVAAAFEPLGYTVRSIHHAPNPVAAVRSAQAIVVGGGNTFALLNRMYQNNLVAEIRQRVLAGVPYIGWSAGCNVAGPSIRTTNDMPIVAPPSLAGLGLVPFQINPHFISGKPAGHNGETREERLAEFLAYNPDEQLVALPEGTALLCRGPQAQVLGEYDALWFRQGNPVQLLPTGSSFALSSIQPVATKESI